MGGDDWEDEYDSAVAEVINKKTDVVLDDKSRAKQELLHMQMESDSMLCADLLGGSSTRQAPHVPPSVKSNSTVGAPVVYAGDVSALERVDISTSPAFEAFLPTFKNLILPLSSAQAYRLVMASLNNSLPNLSSSELQTLSRKVKKTIEDEQKKRAAVSHVNKKNTDSLAGAMRGDIKSARDEYDMMIGDEDEDEEEDEDDF
eukprot:Lankesteria_metandrocarpae@DN2887_c0_g1_i1.p1